MTEFEIIVDQVRRRKKAFITRFLRNTRMDGPCLVWTGSANGSGYPHMNFRLPGPCKRGDNSNIVRLGAHRVFLTLMLRRPIQPKHEAGHYFCHNPMCVRHLEEQTRHQNLMERDARQKARKNEDQPF